MRLWAPTVNGVDAVPIEVPLRVATAALNGNPRIVSTICPPEVKVALPPKTWIEPLTFRELPGAPVLRFVLAPDTSPTVKSPFSVPISTAPVPPSAANTSSAPACWMWTPLPLCACSEVTFVSSGLTDEPIVEPDADSVRPVIVLPEAAEMAPGLVTEPAWMSTPWPTALTGAFSEMAAPSPVACRSTSPPAAVTAPLIVSAFPAPREIKVTALPLAPPTVNEPAVVSTSTSPPVALAVTVVELV